MFETAGGWAAMFETAGGWAAMLKQPEAAALLCLRRCRRGCKGWGIFGSMFVVKQASRTARG
jgi:hypothetical protein